MGKFTPGERGDPPIDDAFSRFKAPCLGLVHPLLPAREGQPGFLLQRGGHALVWTAALEGIARVRRSSHGRGGRSRV